MAFVTRGNGTGFFLTITIMDTQGDTSQLRYEMQSADFATALTDAGTVLTAVNAMTDGVITSYQIAQVMDEDSVSFPANADVSQRASLTFQLANSAKKASLQIPAPAQAIFQATSGPGNGIVDSTSAPIALYAPLFQSGGQLYISDGELSDFFLRGKRTTR